MLAFLLAAALAPGALFEDQITTDRPADPLRTLARVEFRHEAGDKVLTGAFWDGGSIWRVRFAPPKPGVWRFRWLDLSSRSGDFRVRGAARGIQLSPDRRYFVDEAKRPWLWLADTAWNAALLSTREEWAEYLDTRRKQRYTAVQFVMTQWRAGRADENGRTAFRAEGDTLTFDPAFWQRMDLRFEALQRSGLAAVPVMLWALTSKEKESPGETLSDELAGLLARYINFRYGAYNVLWFLGGDGDYRDARAARWKTIGRLAFPEGFARRPASLHPRGGHQPWAGLKDEPWLDYLSYQSGHSTAPRKWRWQAEEGPAKDWRLDPPRPVIDTEPNYEGHISYNNELINAYDVRRAAYYSLLAAPPAGITYGAHGIWSWARKREVPLDHPRSGEADPWRQCLQYEGSRQMTVLRNFFDRFAWWKLRPDRRVLAADATAADFSDYIAAAKAYDDSFALLYLPAARSSIQVSGTWKKAEWLDPRTGRIRSARFVREMAPPAPGDWLLLLR